MHPALKYLAALGSSAALIATIAYAADLGNTTAPDRYTVKVPGGLAFSDFKGYDRWEVISMSENGGKMALILGNPTMIEAYKSGIPGNGKPFPDGSKMAKIHWEPKKNEGAPGQPLVLDKLHDTDFMMKDSKRFADSSGWGYAEFEYDAASNKFRAGTLDDKPPQANDAKCGAACHTIAKARDYVFTEYAAR
jgi:hypothetical protein